LPTITLDIFGGPGVLLARRLFDDRLIPLLQTSPLRVEDVVVHIDDIGVAHRRDAGTYEPPLSRLLFYLLIAP
jgi:hypothetical protein